MKMLLTSTMALGTLCILGLHQPANAALSDSPNFRLVRGGGAHGGGRGFEGRGEGRGEGYRENHSEGSNEDHATNSENIDRSATAADRMHTLKDDNNGHYNNRRNDEDWADEGWGDEGWTSVDCPYGMDANQNCLQAPAQ